jgi:phage tail-like protein
MRGALPDIVTSQSMVEHLPSIYQEDDVSIRWLSALDQVLEPILASVDCFPAYLDTNIAPDDFLSWLGTWVGVSVSDDWPRERRQTLVSQAVDLFAKRGTVDGMKRFLTLVVGMPCSLIEGGAVHATLIPNSELPGTDVSAFIVKFAGESPDESALARINAIIAEQRPAHLPCVVEFTGKMAATQPNGSDNSQTTLPERTKPE